MTILSLVAVLVLLAVLFLMFFWMWSVFTNKAPFVGVPTKTLDDIAKSLNINSNSVVYDLGSGDGRVLFHLYKTNRQASYTGIEKASFPMFLSRVSNFFHKKKNKSDIKFIKDDFFNTDLSNATHIFTYLYPNIMDDLLSKFDKELKPGTKLVSMSFHFTTKREKEILELKKSKWGLARKIYIYEF